MDSFPTEDFQAFDSLEFAGVGGDERGAQAAGLGSDEEIERADNGAARFQRGADVGVVQGRFHGEVCEPKQAEKGFQFCRVMRMDLLRFLDSGPKLSGDDDWNPRYSRVGQFT